METLRDILREAPVGELFSKVCLYARQLEQEHGKPTDAPDPNGSTWARLNWWKQCCDDAQEITSRDASDSSATPTAN